MYSLGFYLKLSFIGCLSTGFLNGPQLENLQSDWKLNGYLSQVGYVFIQSLNNQANQTSTFQVKVDDLVVIDRNLDASSQTVMFSMPISSGYLNYSGYHPMIVSYVSENYTFTDRYMLRGFENFTYEPEGEEYSCIYCFSSEEEIISVNYRVLPNEDFLIPRNVRFSPNGIVKVIFPTSLISTTSFYLNEEKMSFSTIEYDNENSSITLLGKNMTFSKQVDMVDLKLQIITDFIGFKSEVDFSLEFPIIDVLGKEGGYMISFGMKDAG